MSGEASLQELQNHVGVLNARLEAQDQTLGQLQQMLAQISQQLSQAPPPPSPPPLPPSPSPVSPVPPAQSSHVRIQLPLPPDFSGDRESGRAFLDAVELYLGGVQFPNLAAQFSWVLGFFKTDRAAVWRRDALDFLRTQGHWAWASWGAFVVAFEKDFLPENERQHHLLVLQ